MTILEYNVPIDRLGFTTLQLDRLGYTYEMTDYVPTAFYKYAKLEIEVEDMTKQALDVVMNSIHHAYLNQDWGKTANVPDIDPLQLALLESMEHFNETLKHTSNRPSSEQLILDFYSIMDKHNIDLNDLP